ncbi:DUF11 domain-containing protein [Nocardioides carbamazepini]|uniref:DUF7507 domain-containing protein n=1 Tax=Nocardioides carbamazepini TaxID=2854259 RepID=UPI00214A3E9B|nr:sortase [Nocardioides carbamazepini]MCR1784885.1 DUF11 domain-containing protein [Nocardioides carbamazepini]
MRKLLPGLALALVAGAAAVVPTVALAPPAIAAPGDPGNPSDPVVIFHEDFENDMADGEVVRLTDYVGANGETYSAEGAWANPAQQNGFVLDGTSSDADQQAVGNTGSYAQLRNLATTIGAMNGSVSPESNHAAAAFTGGGDPGPNLVEFRTEQPIAYDATNRFLTFSANTSVINCHAAPPLLRFYLDNGVTEIPVGASALNPCPNGARTVISDGILFSGTELGVVLRNEQGSAAGNDHAFDDIVVSDATPQLDKAFSPTTVPAGFPSTLTFTVTNTSDLAAKEGWSFTDNLPAGMEIAAAPRFATDCANGAILSGGTAGDTGVSVEGDLTAGQESCALSVDVVTPGAHAGDTFANAAANVDDLVGLDPPGSATLTVGARGLPQVGCDLADTRGTQRWWHFGNGVGLDFGTSGTAMPTTTPDTNVNSIEGTTVVTDAAGQLLFWSNGLQVFNKFHQVMPNGAGLLGNASATQTVAAFPSVTSPGTYFVVSTNGASEVGGTGHLVYSVVDMSLDGGLGDVTATKNVALEPAANGASEQLTAIPNASGDGFWVVTAQASSPNIRAYLFDAAGPVDPDGAGPLAAGDSVVSVMPTNNYNQFGTLNLSPDLSSVLLATGNAAGASRIRLMDFDATTGRFAQRFEWTTPVGQGTSMYSADFSPSGDYVYATRIFGGAHLFRYTLAGAADGAAVKATEVDLGVFHNDGGQVKRGPDGRMYLAKRGAGSLGVISTPDAADSGDIGLDTAGVTLPAGTASQWGLPQMVTGCPSTPKLELVKTAALTTDTGTIGQADAGDVITYTITVTNSGYVDVADVTVADPMPGLSPVTPANVPTLAPDDDAVFTATYTVTQADVDNGGQLVNAATAEGTDPDGDEIVSPPAPGTSVTIDIAPADPDVQVVKSSAITTDGLPLGKADDGDVITYTFTATNHGKATAHDVVVSDTLPGLSAVSPASVGTLAPGASVDFTATYTVTAADVKAQKIENTASVTSTGPTRGGVTPPPVISASNTVNTATGPLGAPSILTSTDRKVALEVGKNGRTKPVALRDSVTITGLVPGGSPQGTATLYGPVASPSGAMCTPENLVGTVAFTPANGTVDTPSVQVSEPGYYTWVVATAADRRNLAATHACGLPTETTLVHRADYGKVKIETGYAGTEASVQGRVVRPAQVSIKALGMRAKLDTVGLRKGSMVIPGNVAKGGWLGRSALPGDLVGSTVIAGHVSDRADRPGAFGKLRKAKKGQVVTVRASDGTIQRYRIDRVFTQPRKKGFAGTEVSTTGEHQLTLVTCTGKVTYANGRYHYTKNLVVVATPVG